MCEGDNGESGEKGETGDNGEVRGAEVASQPVVHYNGSEAGEDGEDGEGGEGGDIGEDGDGGADGSTVGRERVGEGDTGAGEANRADSASDQAIGNSSIDGSDIECETTENFRPLLDRPLGSRDPTPPILLEPEDDDRLTGGAPGITPEVGVEPESLDLGAKSHGRGREAHSSTTSPLHSGDIHDGFVFAIHRKKVRNGTHNYKPCTYTTYNPIIRTHIHSYTHTFIHAYTRTCIHSYIRTPICRSIHLYTCMHSFTHTIVSSYTYTHTHIHL